MYEEGHLILVDICGHTPPTTTHDVVMAGGLGPLTLHEGLQTQ